MDVIAMIDTGATKSHLDINLVPKEFITTLNNRVIAQQMSGETLEFTTCLMSSQIKFETTKQSEIYPLPQVWISPLKHNHKFILGMNFIRNLKGGIVLTQNYVQIFKRSIQLPTNHLISWKQDLSELALAKRSGTPTKAADSFCPSLILENKELESEEENWGLWEDNDKIEIEELDNFDTTFCLKIKEKLEKTPKFKKK